MHAYTHVAKMDVTVEQWQRKEEDWVQKHVYTHIDIHTSINAYIDMYVHICIHQVAKMNAAAAEQWQRMHTYIHEQIHTYMHTLGSKDVRGSGAMAAQGARLCTETCMYTYTQV
jgi:hypothetical protein